jgi:ribosomal-protein-alanine N-acetyltransferase
LQRSASDAGFLMDSIPRIETERLMLRAVFPSDAHDIFQLLSDPKVAKHHELDPFETVDQAHSLISHFTKWFQNDQAVRWAIVRKDDGELIGTCCFDTFHPKYQSVNVGYNVRSNRWGQGYATEAVHKIIDFAFTNGIVGPVNRIQAITVPANIASEKVLEKLGFEKEGLMRQYAYWKGEFHDMNLFSLLKP